MAVKATENAAPRPHSSGPMLVPMGAHAGRPPIQLNRPVFVIGSRRNARIHLMSSTVSKAHALLVQTRHATYLRDLSSRTHTFVDGQPIRETILKDGASVTIGRFTFEYRGPRHDGIGEPSPSPAVLEVSGSQMPFSIEERVVLIGRRKTCDVPLMEESCSTAHAVIFQWEGKRFVRDLGSRTGTYVNGTAVHESQLQSGDVIHIGETDLTYVPSAESAASAVAAAPVADEIVEEIDGALEPIEDEPVDVIHDDPPPAMPLDWSDLAPAPIEPLPQAIDDLTTASAPAPGAQQPWDAPESEATEPAPELEPEPDLPTLHIEPEIEPEPAAQIDQAPFQQEEAPLEAQLSPGVPPSELEPILLDPVDLDAGVEISPHDTASIPIALDAQIEPPADALEPADTPEVEPVEEPPAVAPEVATENLSAPAEPAELIARAELPEAIDVPTITSLEAEEPARRRWGWHTTDVQDAPADPAEAPAAESRTAGAAPVDSPPDEPLEIDLSSVKFDDAPESAAPAADLPPSDDPALPPIQTERDFSAPLLDLSPFEIHIPARGAPAGSAPVEAPLIAPDAITPPADAPGEAAAAKAKKPRKPRTKKIKPAEPEPGEQPAMATEAPASSPSPPIIESHLSIEQPLIAATGVTAAAENVEIVEPTEPTPESAQVLERPLAPATEIPVLPESTDATTIVQSNSLTDTGFGRAVEALAGETSDPIVIDPETTDSRAISPPPSDLAAVEPPPLEEIAALEPLVEPTAPTEAVQPLFESPLSDPELRFDEPVIEPAAEPAADPVAEVSASAGETAQSDAPLEPDKAEPIANASVPAVPSGLPAPVAPERAAEILSEVFKNWRSGEETFLGGAPVMLPPVRSTPPAPPEPSAEIEPAVAPILEPEPSLDLPTSDAALEPLKLDDIPPLDLSVVDDLPALEAPADEPAPAGNANEDVSTPKPAREEDAFADLLADLMPEAKSEQGAPRDRDEHQEEARSEISGSAANPEAPPAPSAVPTPPAPLKRPRRRRENRPTVIRNAFGQDPTAPGPGAENAVGIPPFAGADTSAMGSARPIDSIAAPPEPDSQSIAGNPPAVADVFANEVAAPAAGSVDAPASDPALTPMDLVQPETEDATADSFAAETAGARASLSDLVPSDPAAASLAPDGADPFAVPSPIAQRDVPAGEQAPLAQKRSRSSEAVGPRRPAVTYGAAPALPQVSPQQRRKTKLRRVPFLVAAMLLLIGGAWAGAYWFVPVRTQIDATLRFKNFDALTQREQRLFQEEQRRNLRAEDTRHQAQRFLDNRHHEVAAGFLASPEAYAKATDQDRVTWRQNGDKVAMVIRFDSTDPFGDPSRLEAVALAANDVYVNSLSYKNARAELDKVAQLSAQIESANARRSELVKAIDHERQIGDARPTQQQMSAIQTEREALEKAYNNAIVARKGAQADLDRMRREPAPDVSPSDLAANDAQLAQMQQEIDSLQAKLKASSAARAQAADAARKSFDAANEQLQKEIDAAAPLTTGQNQELSAYVQAAQNLQGAIREPTDQYILRQKQQYAILAEATRKRDAKVQARRSEIWANDPQLTSLGQQREIATRKLNAAQAGGEDKEASDLHNDLKLIDSAIKARQDVLAGDPLYANEINQLQAAVEQQQKKIDDDRRETSEQLASLARTFGQMKQAIERLPDDQKQVADAIHQRVEALAAARNEYTRAAEAVASGGEDQAAARESADAIQLLLANIDARKKQLLIAGVAAAKKQQEQARQIAIDAKDKEVARLTKAETESQAAFVAKNNELLKAQSQLAESRASGERMLQMQRELDIIDRQLEQNNVALQYKQRDAARVVEPIKPDPDTDITKGPVIDQRLPVAAAASGLIFLIFTCLIVLTFLSAARDTSYPFQDPHFAAAGDRGAATPSTNEESEPAVV